MLTVWEWLSGPPGSTIFILMVSMLVTFATSMVNRRLTNKEQIKQLDAFRKEVAAWTADFRTAKRTGDTKLLKKLQKREKTIKQLQSKVASMQFQQMKKSFIFFGPFLLIWLCLTGRIPLPFLYSKPLFETPFSGGGPVAYLPWFGQYIPIALSIWYLICSFTFQALFQRLFGLTPGGTE